MIASVSDEIGERNDTPITHKGGHVVLVHGFEWSNQECQTLLLHNSSGRFPELQENAVIPYDRFAAALIQANRGALQQILMNLMQNTLRYSQATEVTIETTAHELLFSDNGKGVPSESLPYLFERFYRVDTSRSRTTGGLGLGLAIVRELAERQGWAIAAVAGHPGLMFVLKINAYFSCPAI
ncbi:MAG TPA: ATP-binding protein [Ktedonobacteraceae bacterium]|nr:ATP-binding protein [Ktedonobacteraceae bacterium]